MDLENDMSYHKTGILDSCLFPLPIQRIWKSNLGYTSDDRRLMFQSVLTVLQR